MPKLLIVDEAFDIREFLRHFFCKNGIEVNITAGGQEALDLMASFAPDLVLMGIPANRANALNILREMRARALPFPVIMLSGVANDPLAHEATALGSVGFVHKPLVLDELKTVVLARLGL